MFRPSQAASACRNRIRSQPWRSLSLLLSFISRKSISHTPCKGKKNPPLGTKIPMEAALFRLSGDKNKKATLSRGRYNGSQRSLMICLVLPKIISSTSCLMKFSNIFVFTLLSFIYFSLYYKRGKRKFQSSALMALPKKLATFSCKLLYLHLHFRYFPLIIK